MIKRPPKEEARQQAEAWTKHYTGGGTVLEDSTEFREICILDDDTRDEVGSFPYAEPPEEGHLCKFWSAGEWAIGFLDKFNPQDAFPYLLHDGARYKHCEKLSAQLTKSILEEIKESYE